jgi:hypothetical protein
LPSMRKSSSAITTEDKRTTGGFDERRPGI